VLTGLATFCLVRNPEVLGFLPQSKSPGPACRMSGLTHGEIGGSDGTRTPDLLRDRQAF
jgi:hypothetical protein